MIWWMLLAFPWNASNFFTNTLQVRANQSFDKIQTSAKLPAKVQIGKSRDDLRYSIYLLCVQSFLIRPLENYLNECKTAISLVEVRLNRFVAESIGTVSEQYVPTAGNCCMQQMCAARIHGLKAYNENIFLLSARHNSKIPLNRGHNYLSTAENE